MDGAGLADAERIRRIERGGGDEHRGKADERVERRDQLRHHRHGDASGGDRADEAADAEAAGDQVPGHGDCGLATASVVPMAIAMPSMPA